MISDFGFSIADFIKTASASVRSWYYGSVGANPCACLSADRVAQEKQPNKRQSHGIAPTFHKNILPKKSVPPRSFVVIDMERSYLTWINSRFPE